MKPYILEDVVLFGADTPRSRAYLSLLLDHHLRPAACIVIHPRTAVLKRAAPVDTDQFDNLTPLADAAHKAGITVVEVRADDINDSTAVEALQNCSQDIVIFSGPAGAMVKSPLFATNKKFLHVHPGKLPQFRGSTTMYYSLLAEGTIWASALLLSPDIDQGPVVDMMQAEIPEDCSLLDQIYDPVIRARMLVRVLKRYKDRQELQAMVQPDAEARTYFVIHPVLKHMAILDCGKRGG